MATPYTYIYTFTYISTYIYINNVYLGVYPYIWTYMDVYGAVTRDIPAAEHGSYTSMMFSMARHGQTQAARHAL
jgi:hypothetical protein